MRVLLVDDNKLFRTGLANLLSVWDVEVVGEAGDGVEALTKARELQPDLVLMDVNLHGASGLEVTRRLKAELGSVRVLVVTVSTDDRTVLGAIRSGADGYLPKNMSEVELIDTLMAVADGRPAMSAMMAAATLRELGDEPTPEGEEGGREVTTHTRQVLRLVSEGCAYAEIASALSIPEEVVSTCLGQAIEKIRGLG